MKNKNLIYALATAVLFSGWSLWNTPNDFNIEKNENKNIHESKLDRDFRNDLESKVASSASYSYRDDGFVEYIASWINGNRNAWEVRYLGNLDDGIDTEPVDVVSINEDQPMQCASMFKPYVALAYFNQVVKGKQEYNDHIERHMRNMLVPSSNVSANHLMEKLGGPEEVQEILQNNYEEIFDNTDIVEYIPKGGKTYKNVSSVDDYSDFLSDLWNRNLPYSNKILEFMNRPEPYDDRLYDGVPEIPPTTEVYNKTGTTGKAVGEMGIISFRDNSGQRHAYSIVGVYDRENKVGYWCQDKKESIRDVSGIVYKSFKNKFD